MNNVTAAPNPDIPTNSQPAKLRSKGSNKFLMLLAVLGLIGIAGFLGYVLGTKKSQSNSQNYQQAQTTTPSSFVPSVSHIKSLYSAFGTRLFNERASFFSDKPYPFEITNMSETDLLLIYCTPYFTSNGTGSYIAYGENGRGKTELTDPNIRDIVQEAAQTLQAQNVTAVRVCTTENNRTIIEYEIHAGGGGMNNTAYFGLLNERDGTVKKVASIPNDVRFPYFICKDPLQLTKTDILYYACFGGDGGFGGAAIYKVNLATGTTKMIQKCTSVFQNETDQLQIECNP